MLFGKKEKRQIKNAPRTAEAAPPAVKTKKEKKKKKKKQNAEARKISFTQAVGSILDGSFLTRERVLSWLPFAFFLVFLALIYIANQYAALRRVKEIENITKEIKDLRNEHISTKSELMYQSKISEVAKKLKDEGIKESMIPPKKIYVKKTEK